MFVWLLLLALTFNVFADTSGMVWSNIPFFRGGNISEFEAELKQTRIEAMDRFMDRSSYFPYLGYLLPEFDVIVRRHSELAHRGINRSLSELLKANYDETFLSHRIPESDLRGRISAEYRSVRFVAYGHYSVIQEGKVAATLTLTEVVTGLTKTFYGEGTVREAAAALADRMFFYFHGNQYTQWQNPSPKLEWVAPIAPEKTLHPTMAAQYCAGQGARLPYSTELIQASLGTQYRKGGVELKKNSYYAVADRGRSNDQYFLNTFPYANTQTQGPVHTSAGLGNIEARVWCVKGTPSISIQKTERVFQLIRMSRDSKILRALEYLLIELNAIGMRRERAGDFPSFENAVQYLQNQGVFF